MPTVSINRKDFEELVGQPVTDDQLAAWLPQVKGELKEQDSKTGNLRIELQDSNRPDLWSCEGIARQIRIKLAGAPSPYPFFKSMKRPTHRLLVSAGLEHVRPYVAACTAVVADDTDARTDRRIVQLQHALQVALGELEQRQVPAQMAEERRRPVVPRDPRTEEAGAIRVLVGLEEDVRERM